MTVSLLRLRLADAMTFPVIGVGGVSAGPSSWDGVLRVSGLSLEKFTFNTVTGCCWVNKGLPGWNISRTVLLVGIENSLFVECFVGLPLEASFFFDTLPLFSIPPLLGIEDGGSLRLEASSVHISYATHRRFLIASSCGMFATATEPSSRI